MPTVNENDITHRQILFISHKEKYVLFILL